MDAVWIFTISPAVESGKDIMSVLSEHALGANSFIRSQVALTSRRVDRPMSRCRSTFPSGQWTTPAPSLILVLLGVSAQPLAW